MQPALALQPEEPCLFFRHTRLPFAGGVRIAHRQIALIPQRMVFQAMLLQVLVNGAIIQSIIGSTLNTPRWIAENG
ncbi:Uncharacterised protein [Salmonella enterica subsp. enterica]|uniref:Uncharacterized protein n=1 Tax=Salmonella enterica I TaxID=59201 RepID=A0A3S4F2F4_SALET|nr:Uncharacterised protein [Salmonella enterica subsp. enterica]